MAALRVGCRIKKILRSRLPERLADRIPPLVVEFAVAIAAVAATLAIRLPLTDFTGDRAPYALNFVGVVLASVVAGWRAGLIALLLGQFLTWLIIVPPYWSIDIGDAERLGSLIIATVAQFLILIVITLYQREVAKGVAAGEQRLALLDEALREIDHRTANNYQTMLALIQLQARNANNEHVRAALQQIADRIQAIANASKQLAVHSADLGMVRLDDHLCELVQEIERGLSRREIAVECKVDQVSASIEKATSISLIVNELVTNSIKHAFNGESSGHVWVTGKTGTKFELVVADNGRGIEATKREGHDGLGSKLVESFTRQLGAEHDVISSEKGTTHRLVIPDLL